MFENQIVPKASDKSSEVPGSGSAEIADSGGKVYLNAHEAIRDFDAESQQIVKQPEQQGDSRVATFIANARVLMNHQDYNLALNLLRSASNRNSKNPTTHSIHLPSMRDARMTYRS